MAKQQTFQDLSLPPNPGVELWRWLYAELRVAILDGRLKPGTRLPSTRSLAHQYGSARGTVTAAFDHLRSEGYPRSVRGAGTFVGPSAPDRSMRAKPATARALPPSNAGITDRARAIAESVRVLPASHSLGRAFRSYEPAIDLFPVNLWARVAGRVLRRAPRSLYGQGDARGYTLLRKAIAAYLGTARGVRCDADQVLITSGAQQALDLVARILLDPGDRVLVEDPCYPGARQALSASGACLIPAPVDEHGCHFDAAGKEARRAKLVYVTPASQFPVGVTMPFERRMALLKLAADAGAWIIEDEYDAEYRYRGRPVAALQSLDASGSVIYAGTFTKMLFNSLRLGLLVLPERIVDTFVKVRTFVDRHPPTLEQAILAEFIAEGHFGHHVRRMRQVYAERMSVLQEAASRYLAGLLDVDLADSGMRTMGWLAEGLSDHSVARRAREAGLELSALSDFRIRYPQKPGLVLGFAACEPSELRRGATVLARVLEPLATGRVTGR